MASIQEYLDLIKNAIYGKDVRQAIHDGILQCYLDASGDHYERLDRNKVNQPLDGNNQPTNGTSGQLLRTKGNGATEWSDVGLPTDEQTAQAVSDWLDAHPEATTTVQDGSLTEAKFSNTLKIKTIKDYVTPEMFGAVGDGVADDTDALEQCLATGQDVLGVGSYKVTRKISVNIPSKKRIIINEISGDFDNYILDITGGSIGVIRIGSILNNTGGGVVFTNTIYMESNNIVFDWIRVEKTCLKFSNTAGILDSYIGGGFWQSNGDGYGIDATTMTGYIGQNKMYVRRIVALGNWGINISSENAQITGLDFGYCSLEACLKGICITVGNRTIEPIYGNFRVIENTTANRVSLKISGDISKILGTICLRFDYLKVSSIDLSEVVTTIASNIKKPIEIKGIIMSDINGVILTNSAFVNSQNLRFVPLVPKQNALTTNEKGASFKDDWKTNGLTAQWITTGGNVTEFILPSYWDGSHLNLTLAVQTVVKFYYTDEEFVSLTLASGRHTIYLAYTGAGMPAIREV